jgi:hypothetical protein
MTVVHHVLIVSKIAVVIQPVAVVAVAVAVAMAVVLECILCASR